MKWNLVCWTLLLSVCFFNVHAEGPGGFPQQVSFSADGKNYRLDLTGTSTRKKFFVKVYDIASYLEDDAHHSGDIISDILNNDNAKQLTIKWLHDATVDQIHNGYRESLDKVLGDSRTGPMAEDIDHFLSFFNQEARVGDQHVLRWLPGGTVEVSINDARAGSLKDKDFAKELWLIWFGAHSVVNRDDLVSQAK